MEDAELRALEAYSRGAMTAIDLRRRLGNVTCGDVMRLLAGRRLPLPRAPTEGREAKIASARLRMFPDHGS